MTGQIEEMMQPCAVVASRAAAEAAAKLLDEAGIAHELGAPGERTHGLSPDAVLISVAGSAVARARALISAAGAS